MGIIIIGIIIAGFFICLGLKEKNSDGITLVLCGSFILIGSIAAGLFFPTEYGERRLTNQTELVSLSNNITSQGEDLLYVSISGENVYSYRVEIDTDLGTETSYNYVTKTLSGNNVIESEDINCKVPVLQEYKAKAKITFWSFGFFAEKTDYVFYVPEGTIQRKFELN